VASGSGRAAGGPGQVNVWAASTGRLLVTLKILSEERNLTEPSHERIAYTPEAYYDRSPGAGRFIHWRVGDRVLPADSYDGEFRRPDRVEAALSAILGNSVR